MSLVTVNTGNYNDLFADLKAMLGTTLGWTLFDAVSVDEEVYTIPPTTGGFSPVASPSFLRLFRDNTAFSVRMTIYDSWQVGMGVGGATNPIPPIDATSRNILDFSTALTTASYRLYGDASEGYAAVFHDGAGGLSGIQMMWIGVLVGRDTPASHPNPNALMWKASVGSVVSCDFLDNGLSAKSETDAQFFQFNSWANATEPHSGKAILVTAFAWLGLVGTNLIAGNAFDLFQCSGVLTFGDTITIGSNVHRVCRGGGYAILE